MPRHRSPRLSSDYALGPSMVKAPAIEIFSPPPTDPPPTPEPAISWGPTSIPGLMLCSVGDLERMMRLLEGSALMIDVPITIGMRLAFAAHQIRIAMQEVNGTVSTNDVIGTQRELLHGFASLVNHVAAAPEILELGGAL